MRTSWNHVSTFSLYVQYISVPTCKNWNARSDEQMKKCFMLEANSEKILLINVVDQIWFKLYFHNNFSSVLKLLISLVYIFSFPKNKITKKHSSGRKSSKKQKVGYCVV